MRQQGDIGVIGLAVMGQNIILNMNDHGFVVAAYNRSTSKVDEFIANEAKNTNIIGTHSIEEFTAALKKPRKIMLMVKAGQPVDDMIEQLLPYLSAGDCIIDGGNSQYTDTVRRYHYLEEKGLLFIGAGVSGGEEGARTGPSIMPGGNEKGWLLVKNILQSIAAKTNDGTACCNWVGPEGSGHFVKMVHNAIEYGDMQIIGEAYQLLKYGAGLSADEMKLVFERWNLTELNSYLIEITSQILGYKDLDGSPLIDKIIDVAGQKGTGKWFGITSLELGVPTTLISESIFGRFLSTYKADRIRASNTLTGPQTIPIPDKERFIEDVRNALLASKIISYAQGFMLMRSAAKENQWKLDFGNIAMLWRGGCIIRSVFLENIKKAFEKDNDLPSLLLDNYFKSVIDRSQSSWRRVVSEAALRGIPSPAFSSALSFYDGYRSAILPANLLQAQRDYFGAHQYERIDQPRGVFFHTNWTGHGGSVSSNVYTA